MAKNNMKINKKLKKIIITIFGFLLICPQVNANRDTITAGIGATTIISATGILYKNYQKESKINPLIKKAGFISYLKNQWKIIHSKQGLSHFSLVTGLTLAGEALLAGALIDGIVQSQQNKILNTQNPKPIDKDQKLIIVNPTPTKKDNDPEKPILCPIEKPIEEPKQKNEVVIIQPHYASIWNLPANQRNRKNRIENFIADCQALKDHNKKIPEHSHDNSTLRIATYNVFGWKKPSNAERKNNKDDIFEVIKSLDADIIVLEEVYEENAEAFKKDKNRLAELGYQYESFGNAYKGKQTLFGNWILSKKPFISEPAVTYFNAQKMLERYKEDRCFVQMQVQLPNNKTLSVYGTHLDVFDTTEAVREEQINELLAVANNDKNDYVVIAGDLNSVRQKDYASVPGLWEQITTDNMTRKEPTPILVSNALDEAGFTDCFTATEKPVPGFTVWAGTTVDFMLLKNAHAVPVKDAAVYFDASSDHIPVLMDIDTTN